MSHFFKKPSKQAGRLVLFLATLMMCVIAAWAVLQVRFSPLEGSIELGSALVFADTKGACPVSIRDGLIEDDIIDKSLTDLLLDCVTSLKEEKGRVVDVPHEWRDDIDTHPDIKSGRLLYQFEFTIGLGIDMLWAIALPSVSQNTAVFLNGRLLGWGGSFETPVARNAARPIMYMIPDGALKEGKNTFDVYVISDPVSKGFLGQVYIGPAELLAPGFKRYEVFRKTLPWMIALTLGVLSVFMLLLWRSRQQDEEYGLFALAGFFWMVNTLDQLVVDILLPAHVWDSLIYISSGFLGLSGILFIHRFLGERHPKFEKVLIVGAIVFSMTLLVMPGSAFYTLILNSWGVLLLFGGVYIFVKTVLRAYKDQSLELYILSLAIGVIAVFAFYDQMVVLGLQPLYDGRFLHFGAPLLLVSFTWIMLQRFVNSLQTAEQYNDELRSLNRELEDRVTERGKQIAQSYEMIRIMGQDKVLLQERSRIMRDMHDGIGVYLTSMLRQLEGGTVDHQHLKDSAHSALNDLRLMIDSLGSTSTDLPAMLGMFRTRIGVALQACDVELEWHVDELPEASDFGPEKALNLLRILQEAFTNALKHSEAQRIRLSAYAETNVTDNGRIYIEVQDYGKGTHSDDLMGNGIKNMQFRAKKMMAILSVISNEKGTCIRVVLPIERTFTEEKEHE